MTKKEAIEILRSKFSENSDDCELNDCIEVAIKALEDSDSSGSKSEIETFRKTFNELSSNKPSAEELDSVKKSEVRFVILDAFIKAMDYSCYFDNNPLKNLQNKLDMYIGNIQSYCEESQNIIPDIEMDTQNAKYEVSKIRKYLEKMKDSADNIESELNDYIISEIKKYLE